MIGSAGWWHQSAQVEKQVEDELRRRFVQDRDSAELEDPTLMLVDVFCCFSTKNISPATVEEVISSEPPAGLADIRTAMPDALFQKVKAEEMGLMG